MSVTNRESGTNVHEIASGIFRISTPIPPSQMPGGFMFNQFLVVDDEPLLFHTGPRKMFPLVREAVAHILGDASKLRYVSFSHVESDECGSLNEWLALAPRAEPLCGQVAAMVSVSDLADRAPLALADGQEQSLGTRRVRWLDAPNLPHNWECGYLYEVTTRTLLCGDLFTRLGGAELPPLTESDVLGPAEAARKAFPPGSVALAENTRSVITRLAGTEPTTLALMHGSSYAGNGAATLLALADALGA